VTNFIEFCNPYKNLKLIKKRSLGEVYSAENLKGQRVAIKRLQPQLTYDRPQRHRLLREVEVLTLADWKGIPKLIETRIEEEEACLVLEWIKGIPLEDFFDKITPQVMREELAVRFLISVISTLQYLQGLKKPNGTTPGLIHADLCPNNLLVEPDASAKIFDFSCAVWKGEGGKAPGGTWGYMTFPQIEEGQVNFQTDLFAAGLVFVEALTGKRLIKGNTTFSIFKSLYELDPEKTSKELSQTPIIQKVLRQLFLSIKEPNRNPTQEILRELKSILRKDSGA